MEIKVYKMCSKCKEEKLLKCFGKNKREKDGIHYTCKNCCKVYKENNKSKLALLNKRYREANKDKINYYSAKRKAQKIHATPSWLSDKDFEEIKELYIIAQMFRLYTGQEYHVDHIIPLQNKSVCGLHVPWNLQVIPAVENFKKSNKLSQ
jgi:hypothetical protein